MTTPTRTRPPGRRGTASLRALSVIALLGMLLTALSATAGAQSASPEQLLLRSYSSESGAGQETKLSFMFTGAQSALSDLKVTENGEPVSLNGAATKNNIGTVADPTIGIAFVVDSGPGMDADNVLTNSRDAIIKFAAANPTIAIAVVQAGDKADTKTGFTTDQGRIKTAVNSIGPSFDRGSAIWGGLALAGNMYTESPRLQRNVVLISADADNTLTRPIETIKGGKIKSAPVGEAVGRTAILGNAVTMLGIFHNSDKNPWDPGSFKALAEKSGGFAAIISNASASDFSSLVNKTASTIVNDQYTVSYKTNVPDGDAVHVEMSLGDKTAFADVLAGRGLVEGGEALRPPIGTTERMLSFAGNPLAFALALLLTLTAVAGAAYSLSSVLLKEDLNSMLSPYADSYGELGDGEQQVSSSALIKRAVALTEQVAENQGLLSRAEAALERANLPLRAGEALFVYVLIVIMGTVLPLIYTRNILFAVMFGVIAAFLPTKIVTYIANKRRKNFLGQLPDTLSLLSGTLRAGYSLMQGVEAVSQEVGEPMGFELRRVVTESRLGRPLEEAMESSAERMDSPDFAWAVMAIRIQREVGGNLSELLLTVADTMIARERLRRDVAALTAEGRVSAAVLAFMPPALAGVMYVMNKEYVSKLFTDGLGIGMTVVATISMLIGFLWMKKIINIEI